MKKTIAILLGVFLLSSSAALAGDKAAVKFGPIAFKSTTSGGTDTVVGTALGDLVDITIGGSAGANAGTFVILFPQSELANFTKGYKMDVASTADDGSSEHEVVITFLGTKVSVNGLNSTTTGIASVNESEAVGTFTVVSYDASNKILKFTLNAKVEPYSLSKAKLGETPDSATVDKPIGVKVTGEVTLEI